MTASRLFLIAVVLPVVVLAGCGRKAPLDTPYEAAVDARKEAERNKEPLPPAPEKPAEDRPFVLDSLID